MTYIGWVAFYEGSGDAAYYDVMLPRLMDDITTREGTRNISVPETPAVRLAAGRGIDDVARSLCDNSASFHIIFIHADTGGRAQEARIDSRGGAYCRAVTQRCEWPSERCIVLQPRHETEAWVLADPEAVMAALGMRGRAADLGLPADATAAEMLQDAKSILDGAVGIAGRHKKYRASTIFARVAQEQRLDALRGSRSFRAFEADLRRALVSLGCLPRRD